MSASPEEFAQLVKNIEQGPSYQRPFAYALGLRRRRGEKTLDVWYPQANLLAHFGAAAIISQVLGQRFVNGFVPISREQLSEITAHFSCFAHELEKHPNFRTILGFLDMPQDVSTYASVDFGVYLLYDAGQEVTSAEEAYFKLQLLSQRCARPHSLCLDGMFAALTNVAWTNHGPMLPEDVATERMKYYASAQPLAVSHVDKFPYLLNYHVPSGVRIASGSQVRLGAHLGEGTTVMPAGFVNFNAGTLGTAMVEGRISAGVVVGDHSDIGGGASIMGTLSGGGKEVISIGERSLLGANAGAGISLGKGCTIAAGLYVYGGMKVSLYNRTNEAVDLAGNVVAEGSNVVKARELSGRDYLLFIHDSQSGKVICRPNQKAIELNPLLH
jgi:2,3,4,5-tetrahydropyridine-2-carboxylate N-succinyltransferase